MKILKKWLVFVILVMGSSLGFAFVPNTPSGWTLIKSLNTIKIFKENGKENYMQILDISKGAKIELVQEYAGYSYFPQSKRYMHAFSRYQPAVWWSKVANPVSLINGEFFFTTYNPSPLSFPLRINNAYAQGYDPDPAAIDRRQLELSWNTVDVLPYNESRILYGPNPIVISGLSPFFNKSENLDVGRTFICARYVGGASPWLMYIMSLYGETLTNARMKIQSWGCDVGSKTVMLDGGGSTALVYNNGVTPKIMNGVTYDAANKRYVVENRPVPQILVVRGN